MESNENLKIEITNSGLAKICFFHPKSNSLSSELLRKLTETIEEVGNDDRVKLILIQSRGDEVFCAGASFDELLNISDFDTAKSFFMGFAHVINAIKNSKKLIITRVQNKAVGGALGIICASDYVVATFDASIKLSELNIGIAPFVVAPVIEKKIGESLFTKIALEADWMSAKWAYRQGVFSNIFQSVTEMDAYIESFGEHLMSKNPQVLGLIKQIHRENTDGLKTLMEERAEMSGTLILSEETKQIIRRFKGF